MLKKWIKSYRACTYWKKQGCIFIHVPKAAGTSINQALYGRTLGHFSADEIRHNFTEFYDKAFVFSFVRNPWDRALSAYRFAKAGRTESMGIANSEKYKAPEFKSFESFLFDWLSKNDLNHVDFVFQPQYRFVCDRDKKIITDYIGKVENISQDIKEVERVTNRSLKLGQSNKTQAASRYTESYHNQDMIDMVSSLYAEDIELFSYRFGD